MYNIPTFAEIPPKRKQGSIWKIIGLIITLFLIVMILAILNVSHFFKIKGTSMYPNLQEGQLVMCVESDTIRRGDMVAFYKNDEYVIKRVVGLPGEKLDIDTEGTVLINEEPLPEDYLTYKAKGEVEIELPQKIATNAYFVMGDNRGDSLDSRHHQVGTLTIDKIICKVKLVI